MFLWSAEKRTKKKKKAMEKWRAIKRSVLGFKTSSKFADEPVSNQDPADLEPLSVSSLSTLHSGRTPAVGKSIISLPSFFLLKLYFYFSLLFVFMLFMFHHFLPFYCLNMICLRRLCSVRTCVVI